MKNDVLVNIILKLLRVGAADKLEKILRTSSSQEMQSILTSLDRHQKNRLFHLLFDRQMASRTIKDFSPPLFHDIFNNVPLEMMLNLVNQLQPDDAARLLEKLDEEQRDFIVSKLESEKKIQISNLMSYERETAGAIMNPNYFALSETATIKEAIEMLRNQTQLEMVFYLYVIDKDKHLVGIVSLRQLIMSSEDALLKERMDTNVVQIDAKQPQSEVAKTISRYNFLALPVVDEHKCLLGVITVDDVIDVIQEEATHELYRMAGLEKDERVFSPIKQSIRRRAPWLIVNLATTVLAVQVVGLFEGTIEKVVMLATFLPVVAGMGGNAGTQTLTIMIRGLAMGEVELKDSWRAVVKEVAVGVSNGVITGSIMAVVAYLWKGIPMLGVVLMLSMIGNLFVSSLVGVLVPVGLKSLRIDPAVASTVIVTTFTDCFGFFSFLGLAALFLKYLM